jgi:hypothetical protein
MKISILHDDDGNIIATSKTSISHPGEFQGIGIAPKKHQKVLEIEISGELEHVSIHELHNNFHVRGFELVRKETP